MYSYIHRLMTITSIIIVVLYVHTVDVAVPAAAAVHHDGRRQGAELRGKTSEAYNVIDCTMSRYVIEIDRDISEM